ncbi:MAG: ROK family protein [Acidobacteria bacterium]|jgi:glucokinase|nr:ROK family protein [Acidobacteriota bacterium]
MSYARDPRVVLTLDAGGTNFVFSAVQSDREVVEPLTLPSNAHELQACLDTIVEGFSKVKEKAPAAPAAISFAFPGPVDYPLGIVGGQNNLPAFASGSVALGPMLEDEFGIPVFMNNDGDLFTLGEAMAGFLPWVNGLLEAAGNPKRFRNLFGATLGTGFGGGIVGNGQLWIGDNSAGGEIWLTRNKLDPGTNIEEAVSIRAVRGVYAEKVGLAFGEAPEPKDIFAIGRGDRPGNREAAVEAFRSMGEAAGDALANAITLVDGLVVIGGGLTGAAELFLPALVAEMNAPFQVAGEPLMRLEMTAFNLEDPEERARFVKGEVKEVVVPGSTRTVTYDPLERVGVGLSRLGTSRAVALGAYAYALTALDTKS